MCVCVCVFVRVHLYTYICVCVRVCIISYIKYVHLYIYIYIGNLFICKQINPNMRSEAPETRVIGHCERAGGQEAYQHCLESGHKSELRKAKHELHIKQYEDLQPI